MAKKRKKNRPGIYVPPIKSRSVARAPHIHGGKRNPKGLTLPAHVRINPRTGKTQIFVTPQVANKLRGVKGIKLAKTNPSVEIRDMKLNREGYDKNGRYWGAGQKVYYYVDDNDNNGYIRASSVVEARKKALAKLS
jgi:hypothetical protein